MYQQGALCSAAQWPVFGQEELFTLTSRNVRLLIAKAVVRVVRFLPPVLTDYRGHSGLDGPPVAEEA